MGLQWKRMLWAHPSNKAEWVTVGDYTAKIQKGWSSTRPQVSGWLWSVESSARVLRVGWQKTNNGAKRAAARYIAGRIRRG